MATPPETAPLQVAPEEVQLRPWEAPVTEEEIQAYLAAEAEKKRAEKYGTVGQQLVAGVEGLASGLTAGLSTQLQMDVVRELGLGEEAAEGIRARAETGAATVGEVASFLLPAAAATKLGQKALGKAGSAALEASAPSLISKVSQATGQAVKASLPEANTLLGKALTKAIETGAQGAAEGALYGVGQVIHESALDPDYTAEAALATVGWSTALGGGMGGALGLTEVGIGAATKKAKELAQRAFTKGEAALGKAWATEGFTGTQGNVAEYMLQNRAAIDAAKNVLPDLPEHMANASTQEMAEWMLRRSDDLAKLEAVSPGTAAKLAKADVKTADYLADNWPKLVTDPSKRIDMAKTLAKDMDEMLSAVDDVSLRINKKLAPDEAELLIAQKYRGNLTNSSNAKEAYAQTLSKMDDAVARMRAEPELFDASYARSLEKIRDGWTAAIDDVGKNPVELFKRLRRLRQDIDDVIPYGKDALSLSKAQRDSVDVLKGLRREVKSALTDESLFGGAAKSRALLDETQSEFMAAQKAFRKTFMRKLEGKGGVRYVIDAPKVNAWLNAMKDVRGEARTAVWGDMVNAAKRMADVADSIGNRIPAGKADAEGLRALLERTSNRAQSIQDEAAVTQVRKMLDAPEILSSNAAIPGQALAKPKPAGMAASIGDVVGLSVVSEMVGSALLPGAALGVMKGAKKLIDTARSVPRALSALTLLEKAGQAAAKAIDAGVDGVVRASPGARRVAAGVLAMHTGHEATKARMEKVRELTGNPDAALEALSSQGQGLDDAPNTAQAAQLASSRGLAFLASKLPPPPPGNGALPKADSLSQEEAFRFNRYYDAVDRPLSVLERARSGTLTPLDVEAVSAVYPALMGRIQEALLSRLMEEGGMAGLPYRQRLMASMLLGQDVDGTLTPAALQASQQLYQQQAAPPSPQAGPGNQTVRPGQQGLSKLSLGRRLRTGPEASAERLAGE